MGKLAAQPFYRLLKEENCAHRIIKRYDKARTLSMRVLENVKRGERKAGFIKSHKGLNTWIIQRKTGNTPKG